MRRFLFVLALTIALIAPASAAPPTTPSTPPTAKCPFERTHDSDKAVFHRLGDLPPANQYLAVYRLDVCRAERILARGLGANGRQTPSPRR